MKIRVGLFYCLILMSLSGCSLHPGPKSTISEAGIPQRDLRVFQPEKLKSGGNLLVVPFTAGPGVTANNQLDRVSLMIVKGIADVVSKEGNQYTMLGSDDSQMADIVIKGRIDAMSEKKLFAFPWRRNQSVISFSVHASILEVENESLLAKFAQKKTGQSRETGFEELGYEMGKNIGLSILRDSQ